MQIIVKAKMPDRTNIQIEDWSFEFPKHQKASTVAVYPKSKQHHEGAFAPKFGKIYRFSFKFESTEEAREAFDDLVSGNKTPSDFKQYMHDPQYADCL